MSLLSSSVSVLLVFDNGTSDFVIRAYHRRINSNGNRLTVLFVNRRNLRIKNIIPMISHFFSHIASVWSQLTADCY